MGRADLYLRTVMSILLSIAEVFLVELDLQLFFPSSLDLPLPC